jgi:choline dehydrogenase-like flavoprotein
VSFDPVSLASLARPGAWGAEYAGQLRKYEQFTGLLVVGEDPAQASNGISLHPKEKDQYGMPVPVVHYVSHDNSNRMRDFAVAKAREMYGSLDAEGVFLGPLPPSTHNMGTCRMAANADLGVCDQHGRSFDVPNLFFSDGSPITSSGTANPTMTIVALPPPGEYCGQHEPGRSVKIIPFQLDPDVPRVAPASIPRTPPH